MSDFKDQPIHACFFLAGPIVKENFLLAAEIRRRQPGAHLSAFICGRKHLLQAVQKLDGTPNAFNRYDWLNDMITKWLNTPLDRTKLARYEEIFGADMMRRLITADRELGVGLVTGGIVERTRLIDRTQNDDDVRWRYVVGILDYLFELMNDAKPDVIFIYAIAGIDAMALSIVAKHFGIPAVQMIFTRVDDWQLLDDDTMGMLSEVKEIYGKALKNPSLVADRQAIADKYFDSFVNKPVNPIDTIVWVENLLNEHSFLGILKTLAMDAARWVAIALGLKGSRGNWRQRYGSFMFWISLRRFVAMQYFLRIKRVMLESVVGDAPFIYYPLHVDPEMTTMILGDKFTNQLANIEAIAKQMPAGYKLIVKEHIPMIGKRPIGYYKAIESLPDVHMVSPFENSFKLINKAALTVTVTGTAAWENMMLGRVPVIMGQVHFLNMGEGFVHAPDPTNLHEKIKEALATKPITPEKMKLYIASMLKDAFEFSMSYIWFNGKIDETALQKALSEMVDRFEACAIKKRKQKET